MRHAACHSSGLRPVHEAAPGSAVRAVWVFRMLLAVLRLFCAPEPALWALHARGCSETGPAVWPAAWRAEDPGL